MLSKIDLNGRVVVLLNKVGVLDYAECSLALPRERQAQKPPAANIKPGSPAPTAKISRLGCRLAGLTNEAVDQVPCWRWVG
jgi:hypothetical protein